MIFLYDTGARIQEALDVKICDLRIDKTPLVDGHKCGYRKQWSEEKINNAVEEVIRKLVKNPKFEEAILNKIGSRIDTEEIEKEIEGLEKQHRQLTGAKGRLGQQMDSCLLYTSPGRRP